MIHTPGLWQRKVDDTFVIIKYDRLETLHELNKFICKVQFIYESATNNILPFLDCLIKRDKEGRLQTKYIERKQTQGNTCITHQINQNM